MSQYTLLIEAILTLFTIPETVVSARYDQKFVESQIFSFRHTIFFDSQRGFTYQEQLYQALPMDIDRLFEDIVKAVNCTKQGSFIDDIEKWVRDAAGQFRRMLFEKAFDLRGHSEVLPPPANFANESEKIGIRKEIEISYELDKRTVKEH